MAGLDRKLLPSQFRAGFPQGHNYKYKDKIVKTPATRTINRTVVQNTSFVTKCHKPAQPNDEEDHCPNNVFHAVSIIL